jgi:DNA-binding response OmpR family regulator
MLTLPNPETRTEVGVAMSQPQVSPKPVVLIVEDEIHIAEALAFVIEEIGFATRIAHNGKAALAMIAAETPALVISDLMMPQMNGEQLLRTLREQGYTTLPVILMSAAGRSHVAYLGADATLNKPFEFEEVEQLLRRFLGE